MLKSHTYVLTAIALSGLLHLPHAQAEDFTDWRPCPASLAQADAPEPPNGTRWELTLSPYAYHWNYNPEHRPVFLGALDRTVAGNRFCGLALFRNSFGQPSAYAYVGQRWDSIAGHDKLFTKVSVGFIYGYKGKYQDKIPLNGYGIAPAIVPSIGYDFAKNTSVQAMLLGTAGILFAYGHNF
jgi:hypothetical protein